MEANLIVKKNEYKIAFNDKKKYVYIKCFNRNLSYIKIEDSQINCPFKITTVQNDCKLYEIVEHLDHDHEINDNNTVSTKKIKLKDFPENLKLQALNFFKEGFSGQEILTVLKISFPDEKLLDHPLA